MSYAWTEFIRNILSRVQRRRFEGQLYDCIGRGRERWTCTAHDGGGFGRVLCDSLQEAVIYFTSRPWADRAQRLTLTLEPFPRRAKGRRLPDQQSETYVVTGREGHSGRCWEVHMSPGGPL